MTAANDRVEIEALVYEYARRIDDGDFAGVGALFAEGSVCASGRHAPGHRRRGGRGPLHGHDPALRGRHPRSPPPHQQPAVEHRPEHGHGPVVLHGLPGHRGPGPAADRGGPLRGHLRPHRRRLAVRPPGDARAPRRRRQPAPPHRPPPAVSLTELDDGRLRLAGRGARPWPTQRRGGRGGRRGHRHRRPHGAVPGPALRRRGRGARPAGAPPGPHQQPPRVRRGHAVLPPARGLRHDPGQCPPGPAARRRRAAPPLSRPGRTSWTTSSAPDRSPTS